ncbi:hypothetical protein LEP1GSC092_4028 [Leptospira interrogans serovar Pyrogenes str. R168]|nr:hypothetical protein LEP1GSC092_4028 [Leptospira interrogans serovar Pyrogenes str. R168]
MFKIQRPNLNSVKRKGSMRSQVIEIKEIECRTTIRNNLTEAGEPGPACSI